MPVHAVRAQGPNLLPGLAFLACATLACAASPSRTRPNRPAALAGQLRSASSGRPAPVGQLRSASSGRPAPVRLAGTRCRLWLRLTSHRSQFISTRLRALRYPIASHRIVALYDQSRTHCRKGERHIRAQGAHGRQGVLCKVPRMRVCTHRRALAHTHMCGSVVLAAVLVFAAVGLVGFGCGFDIESIALAPTLRRACFALCARRCALVSTECPSGLGPCTVSSRTAG